MNYQVQRLNVCKLVQIDNECILFGQVFVSLVNFHVLFALQVQGLIPLHLILVIIYRSILAPKACVKVNQLEKDVSQ